MNNKQPKITIVFDRRHLANINKKGSLEIRISYNYKQKFIATGIMLYPNQWKNGLIVNCPDILQISQILDRMLIDIRQILMEMSENIDLNILVQRLNKKQDHLTFLVFCEQRSAIRKYGKEKDTQERYDRFMRFLKNWGNIVGFEDINDSRIIALDKQLGLSGMKAYSKWNNYHRFLNGFINDAIEAGYINRNPYKWLNIEKSKESLGLDKCLTLAEFQQLKSAKMPTESLERVRDLFIFQTYTCLRYSDLRRFNYNNIVEINGMNVYRCIQKKTRKPAVIPLLKSPMDILRKYEWSLPIISNVKYNLYLKAVAQAAGLTYNLSTHWARHTGATILLNEGVDMKVVTKICGHSSMRITEQIYAKLLDETVVDAIQEVSDKLEK